MARPVWSIIRMPWIFLPSPSVTSVVKRQLVSSNAFGRRPTSGPRFRIGHDRDEAEHPAGGEQGAAHERTPEDPEGVQTPRAKTRSVASSSSGLAKCSVALLDGFLVAHQLLAPSG